MKTRLYVRGVLIRDGYALVHRAADGIRLFGGSVKKWEPLQDALIREFDEELGISIEVGPLLSIAERVHGKRSKRRRDVEMVFAVDTHDALTSDVRACEPHLNPVWLPADHLAVLMLGENGTRQVFLSYASQTDYREMVTATQFRN